MGWAGTLFLSWSRHLECSTRAWERALGLALLGFACGAAFLARDAYRPAHRLLPLAAGVGFLVVSSGIRGLLRRGRELALLGLPLVDPLPWFVRARIEPVRATAAAAGAMLKAIGVSVQRQGAVLDVPGARLEVLGICSGLEVITQLLALVVLVSCLFPTSWRQRAWLAASAVAAGFTVNAARVALLGVIASRAPQRWEFWERPGPGSHLFPLAATALAGLGWWLVLRARRRGSAARAP
jgi:exosortase/archaeosortase family protein